ncbi:hypothetical protein GCM10022212_35100 [Actimicrobium antarcticum]|uniref:Uncharacterized protein n=2 Tax=Actimicrobium antarcticum TaxID=1051899 RepID=A0ABP7TY29_9BURK
MEQQVRSTLISPLHSVAFMKFAGATRTHPAELAAVKLAEDANEVVRAAIHDTNTLLQQHKALSRPTRRLSPKTGPLHALLPGEILASLKFEQDCLGALAHALDSLQRLDQKKLAAAKAVVTQSGAQEAKLLPLLDQRMARSGVFQAARSKDSELVAQMMERRTSWVMQQLGRVGKVDTE